MGGRAEGWMHGRYNAPVLMPENLNPDREVPTFTTKSKILVLLVLIIGIFIPVKFWSDVWFGRHLNDDQLEQFLDLGSKPRSIQHALVQIDEKIRQQEPGIRRWYPKVAALSEHPLVLIRAQAAWVMGQDNSSPLFHYTLMHSLQDPSPLVRRNAALSLARFGDRAALPELRSMLRSWPVRSPVSGEVELQAERGQWIYSNVLLATVKEEDGKMSEIHSELRGKVQEIKVADGDPVQSGEILFLLSPDPEHVWEALRALFLIGGNEELDLVEPYVDDPSYTEELHRQARFTRDAIRSRMQPQ